MVNRITSLSKLKWSIGWIVENCESLDKVFFKLKGAQWKQSNLRS
jgi:hypothetical protein